MKERFNQGHSSRPGIHCANFNARIGSAMRNSASGPIGDRKPCPCTGTGTRGNMYIEGHDQYRYHMRKYGHPSKVGYKDIVPQWKAENFDPEGLMDLFVAAGAKYFVGQAAHHDNFHNWDSSRHPWNAVKMGPKRDIVAAWQAAAKRHDLPFGLSEHIGATFSWYTPTKRSDSVGPYAGVPYDGNDPAYEDLYLPNQGAKGHP